MSQPILNQGMSLQAFADLNGLTKSQALYQVKCGRVMGAQKTHGGKWLVFPPARLSEPLRKRTTWRDRPTVADGVAVGTSPHGLSVDLHRPHQETRGKDARRSLADGFDFATKAEERSAGTSTVPHAVGACEVLP
jgi:hypothetical protein